MSESETPEAKLEAVRGAIQKALEGLSLDQRATIFAGEITALAAQGQLSESILATLHGLENTVAPAVTIETAPPPAVLAHSDVELTRQIEELEGAVVERGVHGKWPLGATMKGVALERPGAYGSSANPNFEYGASNEQINPLGDNLKPARKIYDFQYLLRRAAGNSGSHYLRNLANKHFFAVGPTVDPAVSVVDMFFLTDNRDLTYAASGFMHMLVTMPTEKVRALEALVRANPDAAEQFFQLAAQGLEVDDPSVKPGVRRVKSDSIVVLGDLDALIPDDIVTKSTYPGSRNVNWDKFDSIYQQRGIPTSLPVTELTYKQGPYGTAQGNPFWQN